MTLTAAPLLDGYADDWPRDPAAWTHFDQDAQHRFAMLTGVHERMLYLAARGARRAPAVRGSGQQLSGARHLRRSGVAWRSRTAQGEQQQVFLAATAPGAVSARRIESGEYGRRAARIEPRIRGVWRPTAEGYRVEPRIPLVDDRQGLRRADR